MNENDIDRSAATVVTFTKGATKDAPIGHHVHVEEGADRGEALRIFYLAYELHCRALMVESGVLVGPDLDEAMQDLIQHGDGPAYANVSQELKDILRRVPPEALAQLLLDLSISPHDYEVQREIVADALRDSRAVSDA